MKNENNAGREADYLLILGKEHIMLEITRGNGCLKSYWEALNKQAESNSCKVEPGYRMYGKYKVKETFIGEESLTSLLTQYIEHVVSLNY